MSQRNSWADICKGIGIILVVYGHVQRGLFNAGFEMNEHQYKLIDSIIYTFHMPLFFFISGLFFYNSLQKTKQATFVAKKIDTILYPYILWSLIQGITEASLAKYTNSQTSLADVFSLWQPRAQFWFLYALFIVFTTSSFLYRSINPNRLFYLIPIFAALYLFKFEIAIIKQAMSNFVFFALGIWFNEIKHKIFERREIIATTTFFLFVFGQFAFHSILNLNYQDVGLLSLALAFTSILFISSLAMCLEKIDVGFLKYIGTQTMPIYLMHILAGSGIRIVLKKVLGVTSTEVHTLAGVMFGIGIPLVAQAFFARMGSNWITTPPKWLSVEKLFMRAAKSHSSNG